MEEVKYEISLKHLAKITGLTKGEIEHMYKHADRADRFVYALLCELGVRTDPECVDYWKRAVRSHKRKQKRAK